MGNSSSQQKLTNIDLNWRRRFWHEVDESFPLYIYNCNTEKWSQWINLQPGDRYLTMVRLSKKVWGAGGQMVIEHENYKKYGDNLAECVYKLHIMINGTLKYVKMPVTNKKCLPESSGVFLSPQYDDGDMYEDRNALNQTDEYNQPKPDEDDFLHVISNYEGLPVATRSEINSRLVDSKIRF